MPTITLHIEPPAGLTWQEASAGSRQFADAWRNLMEKRGYLHDGITGLETVVNFDCGDAIANYRDITAVLEAGARVGTYGDQVGDLLREAERHYRAVKRLYDAVVKHQRRPAVVKGKA